MARDHFVPKVYLRQFTKGGNGFFFRAKSKPEFLETMERHVDRVCFEEDFYKLNSPTQVDDNVIEDLTFIEKNAFQYENDLSTLWSNFSRVHTVTNILMHERLLNVLMSLKHRTKFYRKEFIKEYKDTSKNSDLLEREGERLFNYLVDKTTHAPETIRHHIEEAKANLMKDENQPIESHKRILMDNFFGVNHALNDVKKIMMTMKICILHPANPKSFFITTDNPGFTWLDHMIFNTNYGKFDAIGFPLTSKDLVYFVEPGSYQTSDFQRPIYHISINDFQVHLANTCSIFNCDDAVFCEDKAFLKSTTNWFNARVAEQSITLKSNPKNQDGHYL